MVKDISIVATDESWGYVATKKSMAFEIAENFMSFLIVYSIFALVYHQFISDTIVILRGTLLFIPIGFLTFIRKNHSKPYIHIIFSAIILAVILILPITFEEKIGYFLLLFVSSCISIYKRTIKIVRYYSISTLLGYLGALVVLYLIAAWLNDNFIMNFIMIVSIITSVIFIIYFYLQKTLKLLTWESLYQEKFKGRIKKLKVATSAVIIFFVALLMFFSYFSGIFIFMDKVQLGFLNWLSRINGNTVVQNTNQTPSTESNPSTSNNLSDTFSKEPSKIAESIASILEAVIFIVFAVVIIIFLWQFTKRILEFYRRLFNKEIKKIEERESVFSIDEIKEKFFKRKIFSRFYSDGSNKEKIRRLYHKKVSSFITKGVEINKANAPREIEKNITDQFNVSITDATNLYEKARYSKEHITDHEVEIMKKLK